MSRPVDVGDIYEVKQCCYGRSQLGINVLHYQVTVTAGAGDMFPEDMPNLFGDYSSDEFKDCINENFSWVGCMVRLVDPAISITYLSTSVAKVGDRAGEPLPTQVSGIITKRSDSTGRNGRGRMYVPFPSEDDNDDGHPSAALFVEYAVLAARVLSPIILTSAGGAIVTFVPVLWNADTDTVTAVTSSVVRNKWGTQRRRGAYGAMNLNPF